MDSGFECMNVLSCVYNELQYLSGRFNTIIKLNRGQLLWPAACMLINKVSDDACQWICHDVVISIGGIFLKNALYVAWHTKKLWMDPSEGGIWTIIFKKVKCPGGCPGGCWRFELTDTLRNKTVEERRRQTLCQKRDNNFCLRKFFSKLHPPLKRFFRKKSKLRQVMPLSRLSHIDVLACSSFCCSVTSTNTVL